jgi:hypothetical protein
VQVFESVWATLKEDDIKATVVKPGCTIHGLSKLPNGYKFAYVSRDLDFEDDDKCKYPIKIANSYNFLGALVALGQALYASFTLYQTQGGQTAKYGYAAFGLTVTPFVVMSIINLLGNVLAPKYSALYMVDSSVMIEAQRREGCQISGVVGKLKEGSVSELTSLDDNKNWIPGLVSFHARDRNDQLSVSLRLPMGSTSKTPPPEATLPTTGDDNDIESSLASKSPVQVNQQETTLLVLKSNQRDLTPATYDGQQILYIPSCPQVHLRPGTSTPPSCYTITFNANAPRDLEISGASKDDRGRAGGAFFFGILVSIITIGIIGGLSHFQPASSTVSQRAWTMTWLSSSIIWGLGAASLTKEEDLSWSKFFANGSLFFIVLGGVPFLGGLVVVGQMILEYGICIQV